MTAPAYYNDLIELVRDKPCLRAGDYTIMLFHEYGVNRTDSTVLHALKVLTARGIFEKRQEPGLLGHISNWYPKENQP